MLLIGVLLASCSSTNTSQQSTKLADENSLSEKPTIVTTFYPVEEISKAILGDTANVEVLVGSGVEPHSYEPTPTQIIELSKADSFVTMDGMFEHIEEAIIEANPSIKVIPATQNLPLLKNEEEDEHDHEDEAHDEHEEEEHEHDHGEYDPHVWLSIENMKTMTQDVLDQLIVLYPEHKDMYEANAKAYEEQLDELETQYTQTLSNCSQNIIIVNHKAFAYLGHEYGFEQISVAGFTPESEPSPKAIQNVVDEAKEHSLKYVFSEGQIDPKTAQTIADDIGGEVLELYPIKMNENQNYFSIMRTNLEKLAIGLECSN